MILRLLAPAARATNRRRWSFRFGALGIVTSTVVGVWNMTPADWHPALPTWGKYAVMGLALAFALLSQASHLFEQPSLTPPPVPPGNDFHQGEHP